MRKVELSKWIYADSKPALAVVGTALFHAWATESEEDGSNVLHCAVAIVEMEGGQVDTWPANMVRFVDGDANE